MHHRLLLWIASVAVLVAGSVRAAEPVVLGAVYNLTGVQAPLDLPAARAAQLAVRVANNAGGVLGRPVELVLVDGESDPQVLAERTAGMLRRHPSMAAVLGLSDTDMVLAAAPVAARAGRVFLTSGATSPRLPIEIPDYLFLTCFADNVQAAAAAEFAWTKLSARTASIIYDGSMTYAKLLQGYFRSRFESLGGEVLSATPYENPSVLGSAARSVKDADIVYLAAGPTEAGVGTALLRQAGFKGPILGGDSYDGDAMWFAYSGVDQIYYTTHTFLGAQHLDARGVQFRDAFGKGRVSEVPASFAALGYDAVGLLLAAIKAAGSDEPAKLRAALASLKGYQGVTGVISYVSGRHVPLKPVTILSVQYGRLGFVARVTPVQIPPP